MRKLILVFFFSLCLGWIGCNEDDLTSSDERPTITSITPSQVTRGQQDVDGRINGTGFTGLVIVNLGDGITLQDTTVISPQEIQVKFSVGTDASPGKRTVRVMASGGLAQNTTALEVVDNGAPVASFIVNPAKGIKDTTFFFDASASTDPDGSIINYEWNFGDSQTGSGQSITHQFGTVGTFKTVLTVTDNHQVKATTERNVEVQNLKAPLVRFNITPNRGTTDTVFEFDASNSTDPDGRIVAYQWDFKDGSTPRGKIVRHRFSSVDSFLVKLTLLDNDGLETYLEKDLEVAGKPPVAKFNISPQSGDVNTTFYFDGSESSDSDGRIVEYFWDFGDGDHAQGKEVQHKYGSDGSFVVDLSVTDNDELEDGTSRDLRVEREGVGGGECKQPAHNRGFIFGEVIGVEGFWAIVQLPAGSTCANSFYECGDMRRANPEQFRGIIKRMEDRGNNVFAIYNDCPFIWPPAIGETVFLYYKPCSINFCP